MTKIMDYAREVFEIEAKSIADLTGLLTEDFERAVEATLEAKGKLIVSGMGKSGIIGKKIAATLASTGTPSFFMHPGEAFHGDLGMVAPDDIVLLISNSGETDEMLKIVPFFKDSGNKTIAMTGKPESRLARHSDFHLNIAVEKEACPLSLAPTSSTTATLAMGDALAVALMKVRNFREENFARFHPGGSLGRRLLTKVSDLMRSENLPVLAPDATAMEIIQRISKGRLGLVIIEDKGKVTGIITDGDVRRAMENLEEGFFRLKASEIMSKKPKHIEADARVTEAEELMTQYKINSLLVTHEERLLGVIQIYDLNI
ncbi:arabinose-5-phosphate isomerase [Fulvitalea axinellae]|uniref:Arabinose-5-phosphate isomerase n=1 Tax=Fulvitalea axinellae TaxID=1182444 RepID=A0AAU9CUU8_9BACT|nr:arabinose-5-phosphate isomerase [Fulvitalea axinellae]